MHIYTYTHIGIHRDTFMYNIFIYIYICIIHIYIYMCLSEYVSMKCLYSNLKHPRLLKRSQRCVESSRSSGTSWASSSPEHRSRTRRYLEPKSWYIKIRMPYYNKV